MNTIGQKCKITTLFVRFLAASFMSTASVLTMDAMATQIDTVSVPSDVPPKEGNLNAAIHAVLNAGHLSRTIFQLEANGYYILTGTITVPSGEHLTIVAPEPGPTQETAPPQIMWTSDEGVDTKFIFNCYGDITLKNIWLFYADVTGRQIRSSLQIQDSPIANATDRGEIGTFEGVIFDYAACPQNASGAVGVTAKHFKGSFENCLFRNCTDPHLSYYGRAVSFPFNTPGGHIDSLLFEHCTFANIGYVYMQEDGNYADHVHFNHCTFLNVMMFTLESGWWHKLSVTNSIWVNAFMIGHVPAMFGKGEPYGGTIRIDSVAHFGFNVPFTDQDRRILFAHNSYFIESWLRDWMDDNPHSRECKARGELDRVPTPQPMLNPSTVAFFESSDFPYMNKSQLYDATDPQFIQSATNVEAIKQFLYYKWDTGFDTNWAYVPERSAQRLWPLSENLAYVNDTLLHAGMNGFPLGDLYHWFPNEYYLWKSQKNAEHARILHWLNTGRDSIFTATEPTSGIEHTMHFRLDQIYPNQFNRSTRISYSISRCGFISLKVLNILGQPVATLVEGELGVGSYVALFNASELASGVYLVQLKSKIVGQTKKLILFK